MHDFVISDIDDEEKIAKSILKGVPDHVLHEVYRKVEGAENYVVKLGEIKRAVTENVNGHKNDFSMGGRVIPVQEPSQEEFDFLLKYAADINTAGLTPNTSMDNEDDENEEIDIQIQKGPPEKQKPLYSHVEGDFLFEYFE